MPKHTEEKCSKTVLQTNSSIILNEERISDIRRFTLLSDVFLSVALNDIPACQHVLRILTGLSSLIVKTVRTQYTVSSLHSHGARLDVFAEDQTGRLYNIEIQRSDTIDHPRRVRFYGAVLDSEFLARGEAYSCLPERYIFYISETDIWHCGKTVYPVRKYLGGRERGIFYDDGEHIVYLNAGVDDASRISKLMKYFKTADPNDNSEGDLSKRVHFLKSEERGLQIMCEVTDKFIKQGEEIGERNSKQKTALNLSRMGMSVDKIAMAVEENISVIQQWLSPAADSKQAR